MTSRTRLLLRGACWCAGVVAFVVVLRSASPRDALPLFVSVGPWLILALVPYLAQIGLDALAWRVLLAALEHKVAWSRLVAVRLSTEAVLMTVPGGSLLGESLKPYLLSRTSAVPTADTVASIGIKRSMLALAQASYVAIALALGWQWIAGASRAVTGTDWLGALLVTAAAVLAVVAIGLVLAFTHASIAERVRTLLARLPWQRLRTALDARRAGFAAADRAFVAIGTHRRHLAAAFAVLLGAWLVEAAETWLLCHLLGLDIGPVQALAMEATVVLGRNLAFFLPAGLGVQDAGYLAFLGAFGIATPGATAFVLLKHTKELVWIAIGYVTLFAIDRRGVSAVSLAATGGVR